MTNPTTPPSIPKRATAVLTCIDTRIDPLALLDARVGDLHIIRNAGALVTDDAVRSLVVSQTQGQTRIICLIMHTDCAVHGLAPSVRAGSRDVATGGYEDLLATLAAGVEFLRSDAPLPHRDAIRGYIYDVTSGELERRH